MPLPMNTQDNVVFGLRTKLDSNAPSGLLFVVNKTYEHWKWIYRNVVCFEEVEG